TSAGTCRPFSAVGSRAASSRFPARTQASRRGRRRVRAEATIQPRARSNVGNPTEPDTGVAGRLGQLDWLLNDLLRRVGPISEAVILSQDGIALGASGTLQRDD